MIPLRGQVAGDTSINLAVFLLRDGLNQRDRQEPGSAALSVGEELLRTTARFSRIRLRTRAAVPPNWRWLDKDLISDIELLNRTFLDGRPIRSGKHHWWDQLFVRVKPAG